MFCVASLRWLAENQVSFHLFCDFFCLQRSPCPSDSTFNIFSYCNYFHLPQALEFSFGISRHWLNGISSCLHCVPIIPHGLSSL